MSDLLPYLGQCAEFCGLAHADMRVKVHVRTEADFAAWVEDQLAPAELPTEGAAADGYAAFVTCVACHNATVAGPDGVEDIGEQCDLGSATNGTAVTVRSKIRLPLCRWVSFM